MGNCLEPSQSEINGVRRAKLLKEIARNGTASSIRSFRHSHDSFFSHPIPGHLTNGRRTTPFRVVDPMTGKHYVLEPSKPPHNNPYYGEERPTSFIDDAYRYYSNRTSRRGSGQGTVSGGESQGRKKDAMDDTDGGQKEQNHANDKQTTDESKKEQDVDINHNGGTYEYVRVDTNGRIDQNGGAGPKIYKGFYTSSGVINFLPEENGGQQITNYPNTAQQTALVSEEGQNIVDFHAPISPITPNTTAAISTSEVHVIDYVDVEPPTKTDHINPTVVQYEHPTSPTSESDVLIVDFLDPPTTTTTHFNAVYFAQHTPPSSDKAVNGIKPTPPSVTTNSVTFAEQTVSFSISNDNTDDIPEEEEEGLADGPTPGGIFLQPRIDEEIREDAHPGSEILKRTLATVTPTSLPADPVDVVITYSMLGEYELDVVWRLTRQLESSGLSVWAERLGDSSKARKSEKTAEAILGAKVLIVILSEGSCFQRFIRDHVALATMTNMAIFPVASETSKDIMDAMPLELKVQLSLYSWTELTGDNDDRVMFQMRALSRSVQDEVDEQNSGKPIALAPRGNLIRRRESMTNPVLETKAASFWGVHYGHRDRVKWSRLVQTLQEEYKTSFKNGISEKMQALLFQSLHNRLVKSESDNVGDKDKEKVHRDDFIKMCQPTEGQPLEVWEMIVRLCCIVQAVRDVLDVTSTVKRLVVEYTENVNNQRVKEALCDLQHDQDAYLRAVSVVSLARIINNSDTRWMASVEKTLTDDDRLVREAGCLALGHLKATSAVEKLTHVWKNDTDTHVRESAKLSLDQIGNQKTT